ncbi:uncharacterized protein Tco025E_09381 [Trypanosoma conorhini]|uniref:Mucin-associated surface protein (MASP) n=1 Tax=Trypanosoma conorhini TaxID=83891 RepID=A0A3R7LI90_9TRYP|nr:uncharacterized protein Tco025E_09381 [Trypanosoma conorhini]RNE97754.1 hypothetical protein Tco025E_09381 [Trypanosoma conorhini]
MAMTLRHRAVCALALLALLCGCCCASVCGATANAKDGDLASGGVAQAEFQRWGGELSHRWDAPPVVGRAVVGAPTQVPAAPGSPLPPVAPHRGVSTAVPCCLKNCAASVSEAAKTPCVPYAGGVAGQPHAADGTPGAAEDGGPPAAFDGAVSAGGVSPPASSHSAHSGSREGNHTVGTPSAPCEVKDSEKPDAPCAPRTQYSHAAAAHSQPDIAGPSLSSERVPAPSQTSVPRSPRPAVVPQAEQNLQNPAFSHLHSGGVPGAVLVGPHSLSLRLGAGHASREEAASNVDAGKPGGVQHTGGPANGAERRDESGQARAVAAEAVPSAQTSSVSSAENGATTGEEAAAAVPQGQRGVSSSGAAAPAGAAKEGSRTEAMGAAGGAAEQGRGAGAAGEARAEAAAARDAASVPAPHNESNSSSSGGLLQKRNAEEDAVCGRRVLPPLLLLGLWAFAAL